MSHIKTVEYSMGGGSHVYELEIDTEDPKNLVIESVTLVDLKFGDKRRLEEDIDPEEFSNNLDIDDWQSIKELLNKGD